MRNENLGDFLSQHFRAVMIGVGVVILLCILALIGLGVSKIKPAHTLLEITVAPHDATISINGQEYRNGIYEFEPGNYTVDISAEGFEPKNFNVVVPEEQTGKISTYLVNKKEGMEYYERNQADLNILETMADTEAVEFMKDYNRRISISGYLPIDASYSIEGPPVGEGERQGNNIYRQKVENGTTDSRCGWAFCLLVTGDLYNEEVLRNTLLDKGYNLDDYEVIYDIEG